MDWGTETNEKCIGHCGGQLGGGMQMNFMKHINYSTVARRVLQYVVLTLDRHRRNEMVGIGQPRRLRRNENTRCLAMH